jgi:hypothetical protein
MKAMPAHRYRDPLEIIIAEEAATCKGCAHSSHVFAQPLCMKGRKHGHRCKHYIEGASHETHID